jgi:hypothetical protein
MSTRFTITIAQLAGGFALLIALASHAAEIEGTEAMLEWASADGPVSGYYVIVSRNAAAPQVEAVSLDTSERVEGAVGETLTVQVAAFAGDGVAGPVSPPSDPITFVAGGGSGDGSGGGGGGGDDPSDGGGSGGSGEDPGPEPAAPGVESDFTGDGFADLLVRGETSLEIWAL